MLRKFLCSAAVALMLTTLVACRPSEDNQEYEPKVARIEQIADKMADGTASISEMTEILTLVQEIAEVEDKEGKVLSKGQAERIEKAAEKMSK